MPDPAEQPVLYPRRLVFAPGAPPISASRHVLNTAVEPHRHEFVEVAVVMAGEGQHRSVQGDQNVKAGDTFVFQPGSWHAFADCRQLVVYNCCFGAELLQRELVWGRDDPVLAALLGPAGSPPAGQETLTTRLPARALKSARHHLDTLNRLGRQPPIAHKLDMMGHLLLFLGQVARALVPEDGRAPVRTGGVHPAVAEGMRLLVADLGYAWSLSELAFQLHIDRSYLVRLFKASTGLPPMAYLAHRRAERAAALLRHTAQPVSQIGETVGWPDPNYFARRFKVHFGVSPSIYRTQKDP